LAISNRSSASNPDFPALPPRNSFSTRAISPQPDRPTQSGTDFRFNPRANNHRFARENHLPANARFTVGWVMPRWSRWPAGGSA
jgi:hypothetical protein